MLKKYFPFLFLLLLSSFSLQAKDDSIPERPNPPRLVNNLSKEMPNFLSRQEEAQLEQKLEDFVNQTSNQIVIVIVDDLKGQEPFEYALGILRKWGVGQAKLNNGIVILVKPTGGAGNRKYFIATGNGLEGALPDLTCRQIEENELLPDFKTGNYYSALDKTTNVLMSIANKEFSSDEYGQKHSGKGFPRGLIIPLIFLILFIIIRSSKGGGGGRGGMSMGSGFFLGSMMGRGFGGGGFGGGGSSGGFGGFGGGTGGGGGAGGSW